MRHDDVRPRKRRRPPLRRKTVRWSPKEVDALLAGVRVHGVGKWAAILRHSPVFNGVRTSVDLKDKWRNLTSPMRAAALNTQEQPPTATHPLVAHARAAADGICEQPAKEPQYQHPSHNSSSHVSHEEEHSDLNGINERTRNWQISPSKHDLGQSHPETVLDHPHTNDQDSLRTTQQGASESEASPLHSDVANFPISHHNPEAPIKNASAQRQNKSTSKNKERENAILKSLARQPMQPPSESSVSPEVLSNPPQQLSAQGSPMKLSHPYSQGSRAINQSANIPAQSSHPQLPEAYQPDQQVSAMQEYMNQSLFRSAAVLADYWRRIGHDPSIYGVSAPPLGAIPAHLYPYYAARMSALYHQEEDDDDDDDDDDPSVLLTYPYSFPRPANANPFSTPSNVPVSTAVHSGVAATRLASCKKDSEIAESQGLNSAGYPGSSEVGSQKPSASVPESNERGGLGNGDEEQRSDSSNVEGRETGEAHSNKKATTAEPLDSVPGLPKADLRRQPATSGALMEQTELIPLASAELDYFPVEETAAKGREDGQDQVEAEDDVGMHHDSVPMAPLSFPGLGLD